MRVQLRLPPRLSNQPLHRIVQREASAPGQVLDLELEAAGRRDSWDGGRVKAKRDRLRYLTKPCANVGDYFRCDLIGGSLVPGLQNSELDGCVRLRSASQEVQPGDETDGLDARRRPNDPASGS